MLMLLLAQDVLAAAGLQLQLAAHVEQDGSRGSHGARDVDQLRSGEGRERLRVAQAAG
jgi:hypothetical protein